MEWRNGLPCMHEWIRKNRRGQLCPRSQGALPRLARVLAARPGGGGWLGGDASSFDEGTLVVPHMCSIVHDISTH